MIHDVVSSQLRQEPLGGAGGNPWHSLVQLIVIQPGGVLEP